MAINATKFVADILNETPLGTPIIHFSVVVNNTYFNNPQSVGISIVRNDLIESTFKLQDGTTSETIVFGSTNPVLPADNATIIIKDSIMFVQNVMVSNLPAMYNFDINVFVAARSEIILSSPIESRVALGNVTIRGELL